MPRRVRSHELEALSRSYLHKLFEEHHCVVWDLHPDYGEDLFVRIFFDDLATPYSFFIQAKATDHIGRYVYKDGKHLSYPINSEHLEHWSRFWEPVLLTVWDSKTGITYWQIIQDYIGDEYIDLTNRNSINVKISLSNILDENSVQEIFYFTLQRFDRFNRINEGIQVLRDYLEKQFGVRSLYHPGGDFLLIQNNHSEIEQFYFGEMGKQVELFIQEKNISKKTILGRRAFRTFL